MLTNVPRRLRCGVLQRRSAPWSSASGSARRCPSVLKLESGQRPRSYAAARDSPPEPACRYVHTAHQAPQHQPSQRGQPPSPGLTSPATSSAFAVSPSIPQRCQDGAVIFVFVFLPPRRATRVRGHVTAAGDRAAAYGLAGFEASSRRSASWLGAIEIGRDPAVKRSPAGWPRARSARWQQGRKQHSAAR